jgi:hypothetical protein
VRSNPERANPEHGGSIRTPYEVSVRVNGTVKAHGVYYPGGNRFCINLLNAPNPYSRASVQIVSLYDQLWTGTVDATNDGYRVCNPMSNALAELVDGRLAMMRVTFAPAQGAVRTEEVAIYV